MLEETPIDECPICGGTGWRIIPRGKDRDAVRCDCHIRTRAERLLTGAHIPQRYKHCELGTFVCGTDYNTEGSLAHAKWLAGRFVEDYPVEKTGLLFVGTAGTGKTHLSVGIIKALVREKGIHCIFCDYRELLRQIQYSYNPSVQATEMDILRPVLNVEVLVLDDIGAVRSTEWVFDTVNYILNSRYNDEKATIITTNYPDRDERENIADNDPRSFATAKRAAEPETLGDRIGQRMWSRLHEMCRKVEIEGPDYRQERKKAHFQTVTGPNRLSLRNSNRGE